MKKLKQFFKEIKDIWKGGGEAKLGLITIGVVLWTFLAWLTHIIYCILTSKYLLLIAGAILFPVGCVHGNMVWLGLG
jgi:hypothetical protein